MITLAKINGAEGKQWVGRSTDNKTTVNAESGVNDLFFELDTGIFYYFDGTEWQVIPSGSGGGGTPTVTMDGGWSIAFATATVGETSVSEAIPMGGVWCALTEENGTYYYKPFGDTLPAALDDDNLAIGFIIATDSSVDENTRLYISGSTLHIPANETLQTPEAVMAYYGIDISGYKVYAVYDAFNGMYAEAKFRTNGVDGREIGLEFVSAAMGTAPGATEDITALFPLLGAKMLFFCQGVEEIGE